MKVGKHFKGKESQQDTSHVTANRKQSVHENVKTTLKEKSVRSRDYKFLYLGGCALIFVLIFFFRRFLK